MDNCYSEHSCESKKRILVLGPLPPTVGGITSFIQGMLESDLNRKYKLIVFGTERPTFGVVRGFGGYSSISGIGLIGSVKSIAWTFSHLIMFPFALVVNRPHLVHIHTASYWSFWENAVYSLMSKPLRIKVIIHIHGGYFLEFYKDSNTFARFLIRKVLDFPDKIIVLSSRWKNLLADIISRDKMVVVENFVNAARFANAKQERGHSGNFIKVLFVGGVGAKEKGLYDVLKAIPIVVNECKNVLFYFVGCGSFDELGIIGKEEVYLSNAKFLDFVSGDEKIKVFGTSDIFVLPSYSEGLPVTLLETMAAGLPAIATSVGAMPEVIEEGKNGFLIEVGDYKALAEKITMLAKDEKLRRKMAANNIEKIRKLYDQTVVMRKLDCLYNQLLSD